MFFVIGIAVIHAQAGGKLPRSRVLTALALAYLFFAFIFVRTPLWGREAWLGLPHVIAGFDKAILPVPRLLDILALAWPLASVPVYSNFAKIGPNNPLAILGKHSLPVFILGAVSAIVAQVVKAL
ncbi:MAG: OpgC domain-containing protein [Pseudorhodoplanes sp.]